MEQIFDQGPQNHRVGENTNFTNFSTTIFAIFSYSFGKYLL